MTDPEHKDTHPSSTTEHDIIDVEVQDEDETAAPDDAGDAPKPAGSSGGGFVWLLAIVIVIAGAGYATWPYIGAQVEPYVREVKSALGMTPRPTQPTLPSESPAPAPAPSVAEAPQETAPQPTAQPEPTYPPLNGMPDQMPGQMPSEMPSEMPAPMLEQLPPAPMPEMPMQPQPMPMQEAPAAPDLSPIVESLTTRLDVLEAQLNGALQAGGDDAAARTALDATGHLARTLDELKAQVAALGTRLSALESQPRGQVDPTASSQAVVLAVSQLQARVISGETFSAELDALDAVAGGRADVAALTGGLRAQADGVAGLADLQARFGAMAGDVMRAHGQNDEAGWWAEVKDTVGGLVTVRRTDPARIDDPVERTLAVAEQALAKNDLKTAVAALDALSGDEARVAEPWMGAARARVAALDGVKSLQALALAALSQTGNR